MAWIKFHLTRAVHWEPQSGVKGKGFDDISNPWVHPQKMINNFPSKSWAHSKQFLRSVGSISGLQLLHFGDLGELRQQEIVCGTAWINLEGFEYSCNCLWASCKAQNWFNSTPEHLHPPWGGAGKFPLESGNSLSLDSVTAAPRSTEPFWLCSSSCPNPLFRQTYKIA